MNACLQAFIDLMMIDRPLLIEHAICIEYKDVVYAYTSIRHSGRQMDIKRKEEQHTSRRIDRHTARILRNSEL